MIESIPLRVVRKVTDVTSSILICGESGGKELIARAIHFNSLRKAKAFVAVNCAAIPETFLESALFGYKQIALLIEKARKSEKGGNGNGSC